jgi:hypothetical protein
MKSEIYNALAGLNRGFDVALESLKILEEKAVLPDDYVHERVIDLKERQAAINRMTAEKLESWEGHEAYRFDAMKREIEERYREEDIIPVAEAPVISEGPKTEGEGGTGDVPTR